MDVLAFSQKVVVYNRKHAKKERKQNSFVMFKLMSRAYICLKDENKQKINYFDSIKEKKKRLIYRP